MQIRYLLTSTVCACVLAAQTPSTATRTGFEVASVKPAANPDGKSLLQAVPGRLIMTNLALRRLILIAYELQDYQLVGDPPWLKTEHYDIEAKTEGKASVQQMEGALLQNLLEDRFHLTAHRESRQLPVYELTVAKGGARLQAAKEGSCTPYSVKSPPPPAPSAETHTIFCGFHLSADGGNRSLTGKAVTLEMLANNLSRTYNSFLGRNVIDKTGLAGTFDIELKWTLDSLTAAPASEAAPDPDSIGPSIIPALQQQLGLKLESAKGPVEVLVIDRIQKASGN